MVGIKTLADTLTSVHFLLGIYLVPKVGEDNREYCLCASYMRPPFASVTDNTAPKIASMTFAGSV